jgi:hypothetical protein
MATNFRSGRHPFRRPARPVCTENVSMGVVVMSSPRMACELIKAVSLNRAINRRIFV